MGPIVMNAPSMNRSLLYLLAAALLGLSVRADGSDIIPAPPQTKPIALKGATIHPVSGPDIPSGTIVFADGKITAVGPDAAVPEGAEVIDVTGKHVYPGLINANSILGLTEISAVRATLDFEEVGAINPNARSISSVNPDSELIPVTRRNGILTEHIVPDGKLVTGQSAVIRLDGWTPEDLTIQAPVAMHLQWPDLAIDRDPRAPKKPEDQQKEIDQALKKIRDSFEIARAYALARKNAAAGFKSDLRWEAMTPVIEGTLPLFIHANSVAQIESALAWAKAAQMKFTLVGGREAWRMAAQLKAAETPVILALTTALPPRRGDAYDASFAAPARLAAAGVRFCISTNGRESEAAHERNLPYEAGNGRRVRLAERGSAQSDHALPSATARGGRSPWFPRGRESRDAHRDQWRSPRSAHHGRGRLYRRSEN